MDLQINFDSQRALRRMLTPGRVVVAETGNNQHQQLLFTGRHVLLADRSARDGGDDTGPDPKALMMMALGSYLSMALRAIADKRVGRSSRSSSISMTLPPVDAMAGSSFAKVHRAEEEYRMRDLQVQ